MKLRWKKEGEEGGQGENGTIILSNDMFINMLYNYISNNFVFMLAVKTTSCIGDTVYWMMISSVKRWSGIDWQWTPKRQQQWFLVGRRWIVGAMYDQCLVAALKDYMADRGLDTRPLLWKHLDRSILNRAWLVQWCRRHWPKWLYRPSLQWSYVYSFCIIRSCPLQLGKGCQNTQ